MFKKYLLFLFSLTFLNALIINENEVISNQIITNDEVYNQGIINSNKNQFLGDFYNGFGATLNGSNSLFNDAYNDGFFEGSFHNIQMFVNNGYFLSTNTTINQEFFNSYDGMIEANHNNFFNMQNYGLIYGDDNIFYDFINFQEGWIFGDNNIFNKNVLNDTDGLISGNNLSFKSILENNSYIFIDNKASFNEVINNAVIDVNNAEFIGKVINNDTINGDDLVFENNLKNNQNSTISGENLTFANTYNDGMLLGDNVVFNKELNNDINGWVIGSNITFNDMVINSGDLVGTYLTFNTTLENHLNTDSIYSSFEKINNNGFFTSYKSTFNNTITQSDNAYFYANASTINADILGGDIEIAYSNLANEELKVKNAKINNSTINSKNMIFDNLILNSSSIYGGFRAKKLEANNNNFVLYFNDGFSGAIVVDEEIKGVNNDIKIVNYQNNLGFFPLLLARSSKDLSKDFAVYTIKGFSVFGFDKEVIVKKEQNGAFLLGIGDFNSLNISDINELFDDKYKKNLENNAINKITAKNPDIAKIGVDKKLINNIKNKFYKEDLLNYSISRLNFDSKRFDYLDYEYLSGDMNDINYWLNLIKINKSNEYNYFYNNLGLFLYSLNNESKNHKIYGGGFYANFNFDNFYINTDFKYNEHEVAINLDDLGIINKDYFSVNSKVEFGLSYENYFVYKPNIAFVFEYLPKTKYKNEYIKALFKRQNNCFLKLGFALEYLNNDFAFSLNSNYFKSLSKDKLLMISDGYSKENLYFKNLNSFELGIQTKYLLNDSLSLDIDLSKQFFKEFNSYFFRMGFGYKF